MPAITFFALFKEAREIKRIRDARHYLNLCDIQSIPVYDKRYPEVRRIYEKELMEKEIPPSRGAFNLDDPTAKQIMAGMISQYRAAIHV